MNIDPINKNVAYKLDDNFKTYHEDNQVKLENEKDNINNNTEQPSKKTQG